ncbi:pseudouridine synthase [Neisseria gonorrhoeae]
MWEILFRYQDFVAINKPQGISVHRSGGEVSLTATLAAQLGVEKVWLLHRLDKQAGGILLFALNPQSAAVLAAQFAERKMKKTYLGFVRPQTVQKTRMDKRRHGKIQARDVEADAQYGKYCRYPVFQYPHQ